jgi:hypothetical protein
MNLAAVLAWVLANQELTTLIVQQVVFALLAGIFRATGSVKLSKLFGTLTTCDMGRVYNVLRAAAPRITQLIKLWTASFLLGVICLLGCAGLVPRPTSPCPGLYCLEWSANEVGVPGALLICAKTKVELIATTKRLFDTHPKSTFRTVDELR